MRQPLLILAGLLAVSASLPAEEAKVHEVNVGGKTIKIPAPEGFDRMDGINAQRDAIAAQFIVSTNRGLITFGPAESVAELRKGKADADASRNFNIQVLRSIESRSISPAMFEEIRDGAEKELKSMEKQLEGIVGKVGDDAAKSLSEKLKENVQVKIGEPVPLGFFERTRDSLGFSMLLKTHFAVAGNESLGLMVVSALIVRVQDRVLYLYATSPRNSDSDEAWAKEQVLKWRDAIFAANGQADAAPSSGASRLLQRFQFRSILVAAIFGGLVGLVIYLVRRPQKSPPPLP